MDKDRITLTFPCTDEQLPEIRDMAQIVAAEMSAKNIELAEMIERWMEEKNAQISSL